MSEVNNYLKGVGEKLVVKRLCYKCPLKIQLTGWMGGHLTTRGE